MGLVQCLRQMGHLLQVLMKLMPQQAQRLPPNKEVTREWNREATLAPPLTAKPRARKSKARSMEEMRLGQLLPYLTISRLIRHVRLKKRWQSSTGSRDDGKDEALPQSFCNWLQTNNGSQWGSR